MNPCAECGVKLRTTKTPDPGDGSKRHHGKGMCQPCYQAAKKRPAPPEHLTAYLTARRHRRKQYA